MFLLLIPYVLNMTTFKLKLKLLATGVKEKKCEKCNLEIWNNLPIPLELHHIDGNSSNNDLTNLQILCPNCHAQTDNFRGKNKRPSAKTNITDEQMIDVINSSYTRREALLKCGLSGKGGCYTRINRLLKENKASLLYSPTPISEKSLKAIESIRSKYGSYKTMFSNKIDWPNKEIFIEMLKNKSASQIGRELGVSSSSVRKHAKRNDIDISSISPWSKHGDGGLGRT